MSPICVAVTGGIAMGKSTILAALSQAGFATTSADEIAKTAFETKTIQDFLAEAGLSNRADVRDRLGQDPTFRQQLNRKMHPIITHGMIQYMRAERGPCAIEVPLLVEACLQHLFHEVWVADCDEQTQMLRLSERAGGLEAWEPIARAQVPRCVRNSFGDVIVRTIGAPTSVFPFIVAEATMCRQRWLHTE